MCYAQTTKCDYCKRRFNLLESLNVEFFYKKCTFCGNLKHMPHRRKYKHKNI